MGQSTLPQSVANACPTGPSQCLNCGDSFSLLQRLEGWKYCCDLCRNPATAISYGNCVMCGSVFVRRRSHAATCSPACSAAYNSARSRNREHLKRSAYSDIATDQELAMRRKARKCPLCRISLTGKPGLPNSKHLDHIIPICMGGTHTHGNVRIICASCNLKRPKDGSDYTGPVTLWAQGLSPVSRQRKKRVGNVVTCGRGLHPWTASNIGTGSTGKNYCRACREVIYRARYPLWPCARCGTPATLPGSQAMCPACIEATAQEAADLHAQGGLTWNQVAALVGYGSGEGARYAAKRIGYMAAPRPAAVQPQPRCQCGQPVPPGNRGANHGRCDHCILACAQRAVELRRQGWTLQRIADEIGYGSKTSVTNLIKTVVTVEPRMGRPRKDASLL